MIKDKSMGRKLIFLDIDGTLLPPGDMLIPESTLAALDRARASFPMTTCVSGSLPGFGAAAASSSARRVSST